MTRPITRRTAAKLLLTGPAVLAAPALVLGELKATPGRSPVLSPRERRLLDKSVGQLRGAADRIRKMEIPIGTEPAFLFRPLTSKK